MMPTVTQSLTHLTAVSIMKFPLEIIGKPSFWKSPNGFSGSHIVKRFSNYVRKVGFNPIVNSTVGQ
jgi:hypothetical protein